MTPKDHEDLVAFDAAVKRLGGAIVDSDLGRAFQWCAKHWWIIWPSLIVTVCYVLAATYMTFEP